MPYPSYITDAQTHLSEERIKVEVKSKEAKKGDEDQSVI